MENQAGSVTGGLLGRPEPPLVAVRYDSATCGIPDDVDDNITIINNFGV